jgi:hypothetical protein
MILRGYRTEMARCVLNRGTGRRWRFHLDGLQPMLASYAGEIFPAMEDVFWEQTIGKSTCCISQMANQ